MDAIEGESECIKSVAITPYYYTEQASNYVDADVDIEVDSSGEKESSTNCWKLITGEVRPLLLASAMSNPSNKQGSQNDIKYLDNPSSFERNRKGKD